MKEKKFSYLAKASVFVVATVFLGTIVCAPSVGLTKIEYVVDKNNDASNEILGNFADQLIIDWFKVREYPGGSWHENSITVDVGTELEFALKVHSTRIGGHFYVFVVVTLPGIGDDPMFDYVEGSGNPDPLDANNWEVIWYMYHLARNSPEVMTFRVTVEEPGTGTVDVTFFSYLPDTHDDPTTDSLQVTGLNQPPGTPNTPSGPSSGYICQYYQYSTSASDPDGRDIRYYFDWRDGTGDWTEWVNSGQTASYSHQWDEPGTYYVKAKAQDEYLYESSWSSTKTVNIMNHPPNMPNNPYPANGSTDVDDNADLSWVGGDPDSCDSVVYDVYFEAGDSTPDVLVSDDQPYTSFDPWIMQEGTTYYWQIIAKDNHGATTTGPIWNFTIEIIDTIPPEILDVKATTYNNFVNITCNVTDNMEIDEVYLNITYPDNNMENFSIKQNKTGNTFYCNKTYNQNGTYYYFIWANDTSNNPNTSSIYSFVIDEGDWWNSSWSHRKPINLWVSSGSIPTNYQVLLNISYNSSMNPDFSDLRFISYSDNTTELDYWIESKVDGQWAHVWVEIADSITMENRTLAWMYYGNPNATSNSNGDATFLFFDDFEDGIYRDKWHVDENTDRAGVAYQLWGKLFLRTKEVGRTISIMTDDTFATMFSDTDGVVLEHDVWTRHNPPYPKGKDGSLRSYLINASDLSQWMMGTYSGWSGKVRLYNHTGSSTMLGRTSRRTHNIHAEMGIGCNATGAWMNWSEINDPGWVEDDFNNSISTTAFSGATSVKIKLELRCGGSNEGHWSQVAFDNVRLRKCHDPEAAYYVGEEEGSTGCGESVLSDSSAYDVTTSAPEISDVEANPSIQKVNEWVNITCNVTDNVAVDTVMANITGPAGFTPINVSMNEIGSGYYYNATYTIEGTYNYFIWANDTSGNENQSTTYTFLIIPPVITFVNITPQSQFVSAGETFTVNITIDPWEPIAGAQADLLFDPSLITVNSVTDGGMFGMWFNANLEIDNVNGAVRNISAIDFGSVTTPGVFAVIEFTAGSIDGTSPLNLTNVIVGNPNGTAVSIMVNNGNVTVIPYPDWDVNMDDSVNILDLIIVGQHWGETGEPGWIRADVNKDGEINILDLILIGQYWTG